MNLINTVYSILEITSATSSGILAGALLTEANVLVPYWRKMHPKDFLSLHHQMGPLLFRFFAPVTIAGTMLPIVTVMIAYLIDSPSLLWWGMSAALGLVMLGIYFAYFKGANERFKTASISAESLPLELGKWAYWHNIRTFLALIGLVAALMAIFKQ